MAFTSASTFLPVDPIDSELADVFGVDPLTKDMTLVEFYAHLLKKYDGNRSQIREFLRTLDSADNYTCGFMHDPMFGRSYDTSMTPDEQKVFCANLETLSIKWKEIGYVTRSHTTSEFESDSELRDSWINSIVIVKYFEQYGARFWQNKWAKEMRGSVLFVNPETSEIKCQLKLERGAEVVTGMVSKMGLETQDVKPGRIKILDPEQQDTCTKLCSGQDISMHLTSKGDGSLLLITSYSGMMKDVMRSVIDIFGTEYLKLWVKYSLLSSKGQRILLPSTQGTCVEAGFMGPYMITSMLCGSGICTRDELADIYAGPADDYTQVWEIYGNQWIDKFLGFTFFDQLTQIQTFCFEAICKNRTGLLGDKTHTELACSYSRDRLIFLGTSICEQRFYIPHSMYGQVSEIPFEEPLWWKISDAAEVDRMIDDIGLMILGRQTKSIYLEAHPPQNKGFDVSDPKMVEDAVIDYEGWVAMKIATFPVTDQGHLLAIRTLREHFTDSDISLTIYSKIKTEPYYKSHKPKPENVPYLAELVASAGDIFPAVRLIASTYTIRDGELVFTDQMIRRFLDLGTQTVQILDFTSPDSQIMKDLRYAFDQRVAALGPGDKVPKDPLVNFGSRPFDIQCKMALNFQGFDFGKLLVPIFKKVFPDLDQSISDADLRPVCKGLMMSLEPWTAGAQDRIKKLTPKHPAIKDLLYAYLKGVSMI
jgi:hypothetical protein